MELFLGIILFIAGATVCGSTPIVKDTMYVESPTKIMEIEFGDNKTVVGCRIVESSRPPGIKHRKIPEVEMEKLQEGCNKFHAQRKRFFSYAGTLWCGPGNTASDDSQLGEYAITDACCRAHDQCEISIAPFEEKYGLYNFAFSSRSDCDCEVTFHQCLAEARETESVADSVGYWYFDFLDMDCIDYGTTTICTESWFGICYEEEEIEAYFFRESDLCFADDGCLDNTV